MDLCHNMSIDGNKLNSNFLPSNHSTKSQLPPKSFPYSYAQAVTRSLPPVVIKLDSGATSNYMKPNDSDVLSNKQQISDGPIINYPNAETTRPNLAGLLPYPTTLSNKAKYTYVLPSLTSANLASVGQLCDDDCEVTFTKEKATISKNNKTIMIANRNIRDGLWDLVLQRTPQPTSIPSSNTQQINAIVSLQQTKRELINFLHAAWHSI